MCEHEHILHGYRKLDDGNLYQVLPTLVHDEVGLTIAWIKIKIGLDRPEWDNPIPVDFIQRVSYCPICGERL